MRPAQFDADFIVIGSGPAGVSATFPLVEAGARVLMIDGAGSEPATRDDGGARWRRMLGAQLEAFLPEDGISPKLRTPLARRLADDFKKSANIRSEGFVAVGAHARGGLSQIWGAFACQFAADDLEGWPLGTDDLLPSYKAVIERIGVSGSETDEMARFYGSAGKILSPLPLAPPAARLLSRYASGSQGPRFGLGIARNAILSADRGERKGCDLRSDCLWGCARGAIYDAKYDLAALERYREFRLVNDALATELIRMPDGWAVSTADGRQFSAPRLILAAGTLGTMALALPLLPNVPPELRLLSSPVAAMPLLVPGMLSWSPAKAESSSPARTHSLAQLGYRFHYGDAAADYATGAIYGIEGLPASSFVARLPFSRPAGTDLFAFVSRALLVCTIYFPGLYSNNKVRWERRAGRGLLTVHGGFDGDLQPRMKSVLTQLRKIWKRLGAWPLPGTSLAAPGTDVHYAGPFAMGQQFPHGTTKFGELHGAPGVFVVDGASFPSLPSKYVTLTIMANADRIGRHLAPSQPINYSDENSEL